MKNVEWIKITTDIFDNRKIKQIEKLPEGDSLIVIWVKILCLAANVNDCGLIYFTKDIPYSEELLATQFNRDLNTIRLALQTFEKFHMIERVNDIICVSNWEKYQNVDGMEKIREQTRQRVAKHREKTKALLEEKQCNVTVTLRNATERERERDKEYIYILSSILDYLNVKTGSHFQKKSKTTKRHVYARLEEGYTLDDFKKVIDNKVAAWSNDEKMCKYLRPETLFGSKFESYLNEKTVKPATEINPKQREGMKDIVNWNM